MRTTTIRTTPWCRQCLRTSHNFAFAESLLDFLCQSSYPAFLNSVSASFPVRSSTCMTSCLCSQRFLRICFCFCTISVLTIAFLPNEKIIHDGLDAEGKDSSSQRIGFVSSLLGDAIGGRERRLIFTNQRLMFARKHLTLERRVSSEGRFGFKGTMRSIQ